MQWTEVRFSERRGETAKFRDITRSRDDLLLEVIRHSDREMRMMETQEFRVEELIGEPNLSAATEKETGERSVTEEELTALARRAGISKILKEMKEEMDSLENAVVTDRQGVMVAELYPETAEGLRRIIINTLKLCHKKSGWPQSEGFGEMLLFCQKGIVMLFPVSDKGIMGIAVRHHNFGLLRHNCEHAAARMEKIFI